MVGMKSSATVQQMHPLASSRMSSSSQPSMPHPFRISPSMPMSPNSLMMSAMRRPFAFSSRCRMMLVLPAPRNPVITVAGIFCAMCCGSCPLPPVPRGLCIEMSGRDSGAVLMGGCEKALIEPRLHVKFIAPDGNPGLT